MNISLREGETRGLMFTDNFDDSFVREGWLYPDGWEEVNLCFKRGEMEVLQQWIREKGGNTWMSEWDNTGRWKMSRCFRAETLYAHRPSPHDQEV